MTLGKKIAALRRFVQYTLSIKLVGNSTYKSIYRLTTTFMVTVVLKVQ